MGGGGGEAGGGDGGESSPAAAAAAAVAGAAALHIRCANGSKFTVRADLDATVGAFKEVVAGSCDVPAAQQRLIYKGRILKDEQTLESYGECLGLLGRGGEKKPIKSSGFLVRWVGIDMLRARFQSCSCK